MKRKRRSVRAKVRKQELNRKTAWELVRIPVPRPSVVHKDGSVYDRKKKGEEG